MAVEAVTAAVVALAEVVLAAVPATLVEEAVTTAVAALIEVAEAATLAEEAVTAATY